jgi:hypothetical protein
VFPSGSFPLLAAALVACAAAGQTDMSAVAWDEKVEVDSGAAFQGPWRMNESEFHFVDDPTVAISANGLAGVAWVDQARKDVLLQVYDADGATRLAEPTNVSRSPHTFSWLPRLVIGDDDARNIYILWQEIVFSGGSHGGEIFFARSTDGGRTFSDPINLSNTPAGAGKGRLTARHWDNGSLDLAVGPSGHLYAAWTEYEGVLRFSRSTDGGRGFSAPQRIAGGDPAPPARGPALAVAAGETVYLAWTVGEDPAADLRLARSDDGGRSFGEPLLIFSDGHSDAPRIAVDGQGTMHMVWAERPPGMFQPYHVRYSRSGDGGRTFEAPSEISGAGSGAFRGAAFPYLDIDDAGAVYVLWELFSGRSGRPQGLGFTISRDGGRTFASPAVVPGSDDPALGVNGSGQGLLMRKLAANGAGEIAVVNSTFRRNQSSHVWLHRGRATGH